MRAPNEGAVVALSCGLRAAELIHALCHPVRLAVVSRQHGGWLFAGKAAVLPPLRLWGLGARL